MLFGCVLFCMHAGAGDSPRSYVSLARIHYTANGLPGAVQESECTAAATGNPLWSVGTILNGLLSFMNESSHTTGSIATTAAEKRRLASASLAHNLRSPTFCKLFPEWVEEHQRRLRSEQVRADLHRHMPSPRAPPSTLP